MIPTSAPRHSLAFLVGIWLLASWPAQAQETVDPNEWKQGYHGFTLLCRATRLEPTDDVRQWSRLPAEQSVLVVFGRIDRLPFRNLDRYLNSGGAVLIASDRADQGSLHRLNVMTYAGPHEAARAEDALPGFLDCPISTDIDTEHPLTRGVRSVATNRPGLLRVIGTMRESSGQSTEWQTLASLPPLRSLVVRGRVPSEGPPLIAALELDSGGRAVVIADQTIFSNQMLTRSDNAILTANIVQWLRGSGRSSVLILDNREAIVPTAPDDVRVEIPPPTPEQVREALRQLPPDMLLEFANAAARSVEEAGIANDFLRFLIESVSPRSYRRFLVLTATLLLGIVAVGSLLSRSLPRGKLASRPGIEQRERARWERQQAGRELLNRWRSELTRGNEVPWRTFARGVTIRGRLWRTWRLRRWIVSHAERFSPRDRRYWTRRRLRHAVEFIGECRRREDSGNLIYQQRSGTERA